MERVHINWQYDPRQADKKPSVESEKGVKISKEHKSIVITTVDFYLILHKIDLHKGFRISAWILRFINNCTKSKKSGLLTSVALLNQKKVYIKCEQEKVASSYRFEDNKKRLNPEKNNEDVYIFKEKLQDSVLSKKVIFEEHKSLLDRE